MAVRCRLSLSLSSPVWPRTRSSDRPRPVVFLRAMVRPRCAVKLLQKYVQDARSARPLVAQLIRDRGIEIAVAADGALFSWVAPPESRQRAGWREAGGHPGGKGGVHGLELRTRPRGGFVTAARQSGMRAVRSLIADAMAGRTDPVFHIGSSSTPLVVVFQRGVGDQVVQGVAGRSRSDGCWCRSG